MTEKKFTLDFDDPRSVWIDDNIANKSYTVINDTLKKKNIQEIVDCWNELYEENEKLKQRIKSRLHYYRELCNEFDKDDGFTYNIVKRIVEDLEDILK